MKTEQEIKQAVRQILDTPKQQDVQRLATLLWVLDKAPDWGQAQEVALMLLEPGERRQPRPAVS